MKKWYLSAGEHQISFETPDDAAPLDLGYNADAIDLERGLVRRTRGGEWEHIPARAFHMVETLDGWRPVYWREEDRNADPTA